MELAELDQLQGNNSAELNDNLASKLGQAANKSFKKIRAKNRGKKKENKRWWNNEIKEAVKQRRV